MKTCAPLLALALIAFACGATKVAAPPPMPAGVSPLAATPAPAAQPAATSAPAQGANSSQGSAAQPGKGPAPAAATPQADKSAPPAKPAEAPAAQGAGERAVLGWVAGEPLEAGELIVEWGDASSRELFLVLDKLVATRLALAEASRLGIRLAPEAVEERFARERERLAAEVVKKQQKTGKTRTLEEFISRELGFDPARYLERLRRSTIRQMLAERAVRAASLASETVALRLIVVASTEQLKKVQEALAAGRDFGAVATELSVDDSRTEGGLVPFVTADERSPLARLAFQTKVGDVAGPLPIGDHQFMIQLVERRAPLAGDWSAIEASVMASLAQHPVSDAEFLHWKITMEDRYPIDMGPLMELIGAAGVEAR